MEELKKEVNPIWEHFSSYWSYKHIQKIEEKIDPFIDEITNKVEDFTINNNNVVSIVQRFDEVLLEKASKFSLDQIYTELKEYLRTQVFDQFRVDISKYQSTAAESVANVKIYVDQVKDEMYNELHTIIDQTFENVRKKMFEVIGGRPVNSKEIEDLLKTKADK